MKYESSTISCSMEKVRPCATLGIFSYSCWWGSDCSNNQLTELNNLSNTLTILCCESNQLTELTNLPNTLTLLNCNNNELRELSNLPNTLNGLYCESNQLIELSNLPNTLMLLRCNNYQLIVTLLHWFSETNTILYLEIMRSGFMLICRGLLLPYVWQFTRCIKGLILRLIIMSARIYNTYCINCISSLYTHARNILFYLLTFISCV